MQVVVVVLNYKTITVYALHILHLVLVFRLNLVLRTGNVNDFKIFAFAHEYCDHFVQADI